MALERFMINYRQNAFIARSVGIVAIALGFVSGMYGLDHPDSGWLRTAFGLIVTGMVAQGYALYCAIRRATDSNPPKS
jgi:Kef-type K+ transport system membrane component KefB